MTAALELADVQGLVVRGYGKLPHTAFALFHVSDAHASRATLTRWAQLASSAAEKPADVAVNIAVTSAGVDVLLAGRTEPSASLRASGSA